MSKGVVWIDERPKRDPERLRRAHLRARQARVERNYYVTYRRGRKVQRRLKPDRDLIDVLAVLWLLVMTAVVMAL